MRLVVNFVMSKGKPNFSNICDKNNILTDQVQHGVESLTIGLNE
jgi:hypothetical protein